MELNFLFTWELFPNLNPSFKLSFQPYETKPTLANNAKKIMNKIIPTIAVIVADSLY